MTTIEMIDQIIQNGTDTQFDELCQQAKKLGAPSSAIDDLIFFRQIATNPQFYQYVHDKVRQLCDAN